MRKILYLSSIFLLLVACTPKAYTENLEIGKTALKEERYDEAVVSLTAALKEKETDKVNSLLKLAELMNDSFTAYNDGEFEASIYAAKKVKELKGNTKLEEDIINKSTALIKDSEDAIKIEEEIQANIVKGKTLLDEKKFDDAYAIFEEVLNNKKVMELERNKSLRNEISSLMNETINKKKVFIEEQEKKKIEEEKKRQEAEEKKKQEKEQIAAVQDITIEYSIDEYGNIYTDYPNGVTLTLSVGQSIILKKTSGQNERVLGSGNILEFVNGQTLKAINTGAGTISIIPNFYDWDKAYEYNIIVN